MGVVGAPPRRRDAGAEPAVAQRNVMTRKNVWLAALVTGALAGAVLLLDPFGAGNEDQLASSVTWGDEPEHAPAGGLSAVDGVDAPLARTKVAGSGEAAAENLD